MEVGGVSNVSTINASGRDRFLIGEGVGGTSCKKLEVESDEGSRRAESVAVKDAVRSAINSDVCPALIGLRSSLSASLSGEGILGGDKGRSGGVMNSEVSGYKRRYKLASGLIINK